MTSISCFKKAESDSLFFSYGIEKTMQFTDCVVEFSSFALLITNFNVFYHNHRYQDDYAQPLEENFQVPTAKFSRKPYADKSFTEISAFIGHYELLVIAAYVHSHGLMTPFLGSSMGKFKLKEEKSTAIKVPVSCSPSVCNPRLLKRRSHELWGVRSVLGFYPVCLITFSDHNSQHHKCESDYHFLSQVLQMFPSPTFIKKKDVDSLWSFLQRFETYYKRVS
ncbi:hypothetical protein EDC94DRAFT_595847 [Helicostylum pulchrum]|nr:hypothetical protein EDC94DRAFT_595847 [Helicostylum pulchrum]